jgi:16S rRNA processing protein RimM
MSGSGERRIALAAVAGAHGVKGELRLKLFTDSPDALRRYDQLYVDGAPRQLLDMKQSGKDPVVRFEGISDRGAAESLRGKLIEIDRSALAPLEDGEYYYVDLIGLPAVEGAGNEIGTVVAVENYGAGDLLEIETADGKRCLIPFKPGIADLEPGRVVVDEEFLA